MLCEAFAKFVEQPGTPGERQKTRNNFTNIEMSRGSQLASKVLLAEKWEDPTGDDGKKGKGAVDPKGWWMSEKLGKKKKKKKKNNQ
jgi:hypothetical protein